MQNQTIYEKLNTKGQTRRLPLWHINENSQQKENLKLKTSPFSGKNLFKTL